MTNQAESQIKALIEAWTDAVRRHDTAAILAHHSKDIVMFDVPPPFQSKGIEEYRKSWDLFFKFHKPGQAFDIQTMSITAGEDVAFAIATMKCGGTLAGETTHSPLDFRLTIGLRKIAGQWTIVHEHHSVPAD